MIAAPAADTAPSGSPRSLGASHYIFAAVLLVRLIALARVSASSSALATSGDMQFYAEWARRIAHGQLTDHLAFYGLPLYAYFLAGLSVIFGPSPFIPALLQTICDAGTATLLYKISTRAFCERELITGDRSGAEAGRYAPSQIVGIIAAAAWALFLPAQAYAIILMPTAIAVFIYWLVISEIVKRDELAPAFAWLLYGSLLGLMAMGVATVLVAIPLLLAAIFLKSRNPPPLAARLKSCLVATLLLLAGVAIGTAPCWLHNLIVARDPVFLSAHSGVNFWIGNNAEATGYPHFPGSLRAGQAAMLQDSIAVAENNAGRPLPRSQVSAFWSGQARSYIKEHPAEWMKLIATKFSNLWNAFQYDDLSVITRLRAEGVLFPGFRFGLVAALAIPGICLCTGVFQRSRWVLAAFLLQMAAVLPVFVTERYRVAAVPGLLLFAAAGAWQLWQCIARSLLRRAALYLALLAGSTMLVTLPRKDPALWALEPYDSGRVALAADDLAAAKSSLERAYSYAPQSAEINFALGNLRLASGNRSDAQALYLRTLELDPRHERAVSNLGVLALESGDARTAAGHFTAATQLDPADAKAHFLLAKSLLALHAYDQALREAERAIALDNSEPEFLALPEKIRNASATR